MARFHSWVPAAVMAAWFASLLQIESVTSNFDVQVALAVGLTLVAGFLAGRWWVLLAPAAAAVALLVVDALNPCDDCRDELGLLGTALLLALIAAGYAAVLAIAVGARRALDRSRAKRARSA